jgi:hypothetical protein
MKAISTSETSVNTYQTTRHNISEVSDLKIPSRLRDKFSVFSFLLKRVVIIDSK